MNDALKKLIVSTIVKEAITRNANFVNERLEELTGKSNPLVSDFPFYREVMDEISRNI